MSNTHIIFRDSKTVMSDWLEFRLMILFSEDAYSLIWFTYAMRKFSLFTTSLNKTSLAAELLSSILVLSTSPWQIKPPNAYGAKTEF